MNITVSRFVRIAIALGSVPLASQAQTPAADDGSLPEIVVTAQMREESLRDVPLSVEALSGDQLQDVGVLRLEDLKSYVPNLQMSETGIANNFYIRGIGSGLNQGFEQSVSIYQDGIYRGRGHQSRLPFFDLAARRGAARAAARTVCQECRGRRGQPGGAKPTREFRGQVRASYDVENDDTIATLVLGRPADRDVRRARRSVRPQCRRLRGQQPRWPATNRCATNSAAG